MGEHITAIENLAIQLKDCGQAQADSAIVVLIIMTIPPEYNGFRSAWNNVAAQEGTLVNLTQRLILEETLVKNQGNHSELSNTAFLSKPFHQPRQVATNSQRNRWAGHTCEHCRNVGHSIAVCPQRGSMTRSQRE